MAKSYEEKMREDYYRGRKRDVNKIKERDFAGRLGTAEGNGAGVRKERVRDYAGRSAGTAGGKGDRGNVSVSGYSGAGGKSKPSMNKIRTGKSSGNSASVPQRTGKAWVQDGRVMTWNNGDTVKSKGDNNEKTKNVLRKYFRERSNIKR